MSLQLCPAARHARDIPTDFALAWGHRLMNWEGLNNYVVSTARYLKEIGVRAGGIVLILPLAAPEYFIVLLALWRIGALPCALDKDTMLAHGPSLLSALKPCLGIAPHSVKECRAMTLKWADIEQVVAYGYNDTFLGGASARMPEIEMSLPAMVLTEITQDGISTIRLTHEELRSAGTGLEGFLAALDSGKTYIIGG